MGFFKSALAGAAVVYGLQYITKTRENGSSILLDFIDDPADFVDNIKEYAAEKAEQAKDVASDVTEKVKVKVGL